jgi:hypothetical protein
MKTEDTRADQIIALASSGNGAAADFLRAWYRFCHLLDDLIDRDTPAPLTANTVAASMVSLIGVLSFNPFYQMNKSQLWGLVVQAANAWVDSEEGAQPKDVLKGMWHEVVFHVAFITGGWTALRGVSALREYDFEKGGE